MHRHLIRFVALLLAVTGAALMGGTQGPAQAIVDRDCGDFSTQAAAQNFYINAGGPQNDPHALDDDGDGVACESNPCPCSTSTGGGGGGDGSTSPPPAQPEVKRQPAIVIRVIDGDTVLVRLVGGPKATVRMLGIDTPEFKPKECGAGQAKKLTSNLLPEGQRVLLVSDPTQSLQDRFKRLLRYVQKGPKDIDHRILQRGFGKVFVVGKPFQRVAKYKAAQASAKRADRGLWATCF